MSHVRARRNAARREGLAREVDCPKCKVAAGTGCRKLNVLLRSAGAPMPPAPCAKAHGERLARAAAVAAERRASDQAFVTHLVDEVDARDALPQLAERVKAVMLQLERLVYKVRKASHAGRCSVCSGGEVWTGEPHPDPSRVPDLLESDEDLGERPQRVLGRCPVCNGHVDLDCDVLDCRKC